MNGVIVLNKPKGKTSHDMIYLCRRLLHIRRIGHTGTLDPNATGVLPICVGNATKAAQYIMDSKKRYTAQLILGSRTDTLDSTGVVTHRKNTTVTYDMLCAACKHFVGDIEQIPPMYSAVKIDGKKLYEYAREGVEVERKPRPVTVYSIDIKQYNERKAIAEIDIECSKGTYIRTLCDDIGERLGCYAHMGELVRTYSGGFDISESYTPEILERICESGTIKSALIKTDEIFSEYEAVKLDKTETFRVKNGVAIEKEGLAENKSYRLYDENGGFLCVSKQKDGRLTMQTSFWTA